MDKVETKEKLNTAIEILRSSYDEKEIVSMFFNLLVREHRTHQQRIINKLYFILKEYAQYGVEYGSDLRNEEATKWAQEATKKEFLFPLI